MTQYLLPIKRICHEPVGVPVGVLSAKPHNHEFHLWQNGTEYAKTFVGKYDSDNHNLWLIPGTCTFLVAWKHCITTVERKVRTYKLRLQLYTFHHCHTLFLFRALKLFKHIAQAILGFRQTIFFRCLFVRKYYHCSLIQLHWIINHKI